MSNAVRQLAALVALSLVVGACGSSPTPSAPSSSQAIQSIAITANLISVTSAGQTVQAIAMAAVSNGPSQDVTATCTRWQSDNASVLTVTGTGMLTAHGSGSATITTVCQGVTGHGQMTVTLKPLPPVTYTLSGTVTDNFSHGILPNIVVQIATGPNAGAMTRTDATGTYTLTGLSPATASVTFSAVSYRTTTTTVTIAGDTSLDMVLPRNLLNPSDGVFNYALTPHLISASGCNGQPQPVNGTAAGSLAVSDDGTQMRFGPLSIAPSTFQGLTFNLVRSGNAISGRLDGSTYPSAFSTLVFDFFTMTVASGVVDNATGQMSGLVTGYYDVDDQPPTTFSCSGGQIAFTLAPRP